MRRRALIVLILASAPILSVLAGVPAAAHSCANAIQIEPGEPQSITIGVPAEATAIVEVFISMPKGFRTTNVQSAADWTGNQVGNGARFTGGRIQSFGCGFFTVTGVAEQRGELLFPVTTTGEDGVETVFDKKDPSDVHAGQVVFVGAPGDAGDEEGSDNGGALATGAIVLAVAGGAVFMARRLSRPSSTRSRGGGRRRAEPAKGGSAKGRPAKGGSAKGRSKPTKRRR